MQKTEILAWLRETSPERLELLYSEADRIRRANVGDAVHLRGLIEISNHCVRACGYCGISTHNKNLVRYRMTKEEIRGCAQQAVAFGYGTVVLQSGEDPGLSREFITEVIRIIKAETPLAVTLSLGERSFQELCDWKAAGADRYLLRFETSDKKLFDAIHPPAPGCTDSDRLTLLNMLKSIGYEPGSGVMIGIPGQTFESLANDILLFRELDLDMIGVGPFIPHPRTPLASENHGVAGQVPNSEEMAYKVIALARLLRPDANIPSTTALATLNLAQGRELGLQRGANIVMPNLTPLKYRALYEIYPAKACIRETADDCNACLLRRIESIGRTVGTGPGGRGSAGKTSPDL